MPEAPDGPRILSFPRLAEASPPRPALEAVRVTRGRRAVLDGLTLGLPGAGVTALMGPNGAGKSLTLRVLAGLIRPETGAVRRAPRETALVFQRPVLLRRSVVGNLDHALRAAGVARRARRERTEELLALGGLEALRSRPARALSGGEAQRLALVRALAGRPRLLLLDEPTASLDPRATAAIESIVARCAAEGVEVVLVTHDRGQAARLADRVAFLHQGRVAEAGPAARILRHPGSEAAAAYLEGRLLL